jgi:glycosyltransferase involved in cell wall biosynthesis
VVRVLFWSDLFAPYVGGAELFGAELLRGLAARGHELCVLTSHGEQQLPDEEEIDGTLVHRLPMRAAIAQGDVSALARVLRAVTELKSELAPELVHVHAAGPSLLFHLRTRPERTPWLLGLQQQLLGSQKGGGSSLLRDGLASASWVVGCSELVTEQARGLVPGLAARSSTIYNSVPTTGVGAQPGPPPVEPVVVFVGRLVPAKGVDVLLHALVLLQEHAPAVRLVVVGDGPERPTLERLTGELGLERVVDFRGLLEPDAVPEALRGATVVVTPSRREGLPLVALQAALLARPLVASRVGGLPELVRDGETGWLVEPDDPQTLASALQRVLDDPAGAARLGQAGRARVLESFAAETAIERFDALYAQLLAEQR